MIFVKIESKVLNLRFSEKKAVWKLILYVHVTLGYMYIGNAEKADLVNIVFPSGCHRVLNFFGYDVYTMALRGPYDVVLTS